MSRKRVKGGIKAIVREAARHARAVRTSEQIERLTSDVSKGLASTDNVRQSFDLFATCALFFVGAILQDPVELTLPGEEKRVVSPDELRDVALLRMGKHMSELAARVVGDPRAAKDPLPRVASEEKR